MNVESATVCSSEPFRSIDIASLEVFDENIMFRRGEDRGVWIFTVVSDDEEETVPFFSKILSILEAAGKTVCYSRSRPDREYGYTELEVILSREDVW